MRARHYGPGMGRFLTRDTWAGGYNSPHSLNRWLYVGGKKVEYCHEKIRVMTTMKVLTIFPLSMQPKAQVKNIFNRAKSMHLMRQL